MKIANSIYKFQYSKGDKERKKSSLVIILYPPQFVQWQHQLLLGEWGRGPGIESTI